MNPKVLELINHPFIVSLKFAFQTQDKLYMVSSSQILTETMRAQHNYADCAYNRNRHRYWTIFLVENYSSTWEKEDSKKIEV